MTEDRDTGSPGGPIRPPLEPDHPHTLEGSLRTDLSRIVDACATEDAVAFVAVGDRFDDDLRYLTRFFGPDHPFALVVAPSVGDRAGRAVLCAPSRFADEARREFVESARTDEDDDGAGNEPSAFHDGAVREVRSADVDYPAGKRAAAVVHDLTGDGSANDAPTDDGSDGSPTVLVPRTIPHDAAVYLERAGYAVTATSAVSEMRAVKTPAEVDRLRRVQRATARAMARAETILAESEVRVEAEVGAEDGTGSDTPVLRWNGGPLSTERLRRQVHATLAAYGVGDADNTTVGAGATAGESRSAAVELLRPGETVVVELAPRGPHGYYGCLSRTFVVESDGGWERRAYVAVEAAREAALAEVEPGARASAVHREAAAELAAYGFDPNASEGQSGFTHRAGHGVGMSRHEPPSLTSDVELRPGHVVAIEPGVYEPDVGGVRLKDLVAVTDDGHEVLATYPFGTTPVRRVR